MPVGLETPSVDRALIRRVRDEYREMPGLSPTSAQVQRLFGIDRATCRAVLETLVRRGFLARNSNGRYVLLDLAA